MLLTGITPEESNNRSNCDICVFSFDQIIIILKLRPSRFTLCACVLNISNDNNVYHADLYRGSVHLHLTNLNRLRKRERSADLKWLSKLKWFQQRVSLHLFSNESAFLNVQLNERFKDSLKDNLLPPPCGETMKLHWLTACLEHAGEISTEKVSCQSNSRIRTNCFIYIYIYITIYIIY